MKTIKEINQTINNLLNLGEKLCLEETENSTEIISLIMMMSDQQRMKVAEEAIHDEVAISAIRNLKALHGLKRFVASNKYSTERRLAGIEKIKDDDYFLVNVLMEMLETDRCNAVRLHLDDKLIIKKIISEIITETEINLLIQISFNYKYIETLAIERKEQIKKKKQSPY